MKHFSISEWADYVHRLVASDAAEQMKAHLGSGCKQCCATVRTLEKLVAVIAADTSRDVPQYVIHNAKSIFSLQMPEKATVATQIARLVFDSFRQPLTAGVRTEQRVTRHAVYQAGDYCVDLRLERENKTGRINLVGQLGHRVVPAATIANVRISLLADGRVVADALSNEYGEFHFEYDPKQHVRLHVPVDRTGKSIEVRLDELSLRQPADTDDVDSNAKRHK